MFVEQNVSLSYGTQRYHGKVWRFDDEPNNKHHWYWFSKDIIDYFKITDRTWHRWRSDLLAKKDFFDADCKRSINWSVPKRKNLITFCGLCKLAKYAFGDISIKTEKPRPFKYSGNGFLRLFKGDNNRWCICFGEDRMDYYYADMSLPSDMVHIDGWHGVSPRDILLDDRLLVICDLKKDIAHKCHWINPNNKDDESELLTDQYVLMLRRICNNAD